MADGVAPLASAVSGANFEQAAELVLAFLREHVPMDFWSVTRVENDRQTYLYLGDNGYALQRGGSHAWQDSFCVHMVDGRAPAVVADAQQVPLYAGAGVNALVEIGAYAGARIDDADGQLFGALCGLARRPGDEEALKSAEPLLVLLGRLLTTVLRADRARDEAARRELDAEVRAHTDALTGLYNRRAWDRLLEEEQSRFERFADPTVVAVLDLDRMKEVNDSLGHEAGDRYLRSAARALHAVVRDADVVARTGGDEFGVLLRGCTVQQAPAAVARLVDALREVDIPASAGWCALEAGRGVDAAVRRADAAMYAQKRSTRSR